jgi:hypothetical protein
MTTKERKPTAAQLRLLAQIDARGPLFVEHTIWGDRYYLPNGRQIRNRTVLRLMPWLVVSDRGLFDGLPQGYRVKDGI